MIAKALKIAMLSHCILWLTNSQVLGQAVTVYVNSVAASEAAGEAIVELNLGGSTAVPLSFKWATEDGTAKALVDYVPTNGAVTLNPGEATPSIKIPLIRNGVLDGVRQFQVTFSNPTPGAVLPEPAIVTIVDAELNGSVDPDFHPTTEPPPRSWGGPFFVAVVPTGKPGDAGKYWFSSGPDDVARFDADGSRDSGFQLEDALLYPPPQTVYHWLTPLLALQDGGLLVWERSYIEESEAYYTNRLLRLRSDGRRDPGFADPLSDHGDWVPESNPLLLAAEQAGKGIILVSQPKFAHPGSDFARVIRLRPDGRLDPSFAEGRFTRSGILNGQMLHTLLLDSRQRILVRGKFDHLNGVETPYVVRLSPDGQPDPNFKPKLPTGVNLDSVGFAHDVALDGADRILLMPDYPADSELPPPIRLNEDGTLDDSFYEGTPPFRMGQMFTDYDGGVLVIGEGLRRLDPDGHLDAGFHPIGTVSSGRPPCQSCEFGPVLAVDSSGRILLASGLGMVNGELVTGLTRLERDAATRRQFRADYPREFRSRHFRPSGFGESESVARIRIYRTGDTREPASVDISTVDDTAKAGRDYQAISVRRQFAAMENELQIEVPLLDNRVSDGDRQFRIALRQPSAGYGVPSLHAPFVILDDEVALFPGSIRHLADGRTRMTLFNPPTFGEVALEASLDLKHWDFIATARADDTDQHILTFTDDNSESSGRFYRVILP